MLNLSLLAVSRGEQRVRDEIAPDDPFWEDTGLHVLAPLQVDLQASSVGEGVLVRGDLHTRIQLECRRCLTAVPWQVDASLDLLFEPLSEEEETELAGEVYPLPRRGDELDLCPAIREQLLLRVPQFVVCREACRGLCPQCGTDLNQDTCECVPERGVDPWDALKKLKFD